MSARTIDDVREGIISALVEENHGKTTLAAYFSWTSSPGRHQWDTV